MHVVENKTVGKNPSHLAVTIGFANYEVTEQLTKEPTVCEWM